MRWRGDRSVVVLRSAALFGMALEIQRGGRMRPRFLPPDPGRVLATVDRFGWPVRVDVFRPSRLNSRLFVVVAVLLVALASGTRWSRTIGATTSTPAPTPVEGGSVTCGDMP
jgi:hypothetical protein